MQVRLKLGESDNLFRFLYVRVIDWVFGITERSLTVTSFTFALQTLHGLRFSYRNLDAFYAYFPSHDASPHKS